ncbi:uncharacterized protein K444DRAFT_612065 [Hyaloscypha bicolor E]|uniref:Uncharacterized protein n=1 Tax=Hyaloscypha bicolor E TaxID=1095630 RepID=A0A2J6TFR0_9HELO|nr:uncharacterized protein K444DRAFT_612065 [Hyaloscypha bicolor E]PMD61843.1 hypothetical protein K444DRAFT_612065 [Hyaloscypha bicolor E]
MADWSNATWDSIPAYRLSKETVDAFLQGLFGYYEFYTRLSTDYWQFWIPYKLTQAQRTQLMEKRTRGST